MEPISVKIGLIDKRILVNTNRILEDVDSANENEGVAGKFFQVRDQACHVLPVSLRIAIRYPFLRRGARTNDNIDILAIDLGNIL
jgi:hypothetical protein